MNEFASYSILSDKVKNSHLPQYVKDWFFEHVDAFPFEKSISDLDGNIFKITDKIVDDGEYLICYSSINNIFHFICLDDVGNMKIHGKSNNIIGILTFR